MAIVERGNVQLTVEDDDVERYLAKGYNVVDKKGKVLKQCVPTDLKALQTAFVENGKKIKELEEEIARLRQEKAKSQTTVADKTETAQIITDAAEVTTEESEKPKRGGRGRKATE